MEAAATATAQPKKRGRPRKVVPVGDEGAAPVKVEAAEKKSAGVRGVATKTGAGASASASASASAAAVASKGAKKKGAKKEEVAKKGVKVLKTVEGGAAAVGEGKEKEKEGDGETKKLADRPTPVTPSTSKVLRHVYAAGTLKPPPSSMHMADKIQSTKPATATSTSWGNTPLPTLAPTSTTQTASPTVRATASPPRPDVQTTRAPAPQSPTTTLPPNPLPAPKSAPNRPTPTTIPLPSHPASPRSKPLSPQTLQNQQTERAIREGRMPSKYRAAGWRVTAIIVGVPIVLVVGMDLCRRWEEGTRVRRKFGGMGVD